MTISTEDGILYLNRNDVEIACNTIDPVAVIRDCLKCTHLARSFFLMKPICPGQMVKMNR